MNRKEMIVVGVIILTSFISGSFAAPAIQQVFVTNFPSNQQVTVTNIPKNQNVTVTNFPGQTVTKVVYVMQNATVTLPAQPGAVSLANVSVTGYREVDVHVFAASSNPNSALRFLAVSAPDRYFPGIGDSAYWPFQAYAIVDNVWQGSVSFTMEPASVFSSPQPGTFVRILNTGTELRLWASSGSSSQIIVSGLTIALYLIP